MVKDKDAIIDDIKNYIAENGGSYSDWYVGIASKPKERLFQDHKVKENTATWIYQKTESANIARSIEDYFVNTLGTDGGTGGGDDSTDSVYAYKKFPHTDP